MGVRTLGGSVKTESLGDGCVAGVSPAIRRGDAFDTPSRLSAKVCSKVE